MCKVDSPFSLLCLCMLLLREDILSAGEFHAPAFAHLTNYIAAFSKDRQEWETYVNQDDSPILNVDEFGKTFIDYALEAENYDLLKYLMDKGYIWFVGEDETDCLTYCTGFGAGTSIEKKKFPYPQNLNVLNVQLKMRDELRTNMIGLAIRHKDMEMLENLHAREIPTLYQLVFFSLPPKGCNEYYNPKLMESLLFADNGILEYFSEEFEIIDRIGQQNRFIFPFIGELIERLLQNKNCFVEQMLENAIRHNQSVYDQLTVLLNDTVRTCRGLYYDITYVAVKNDLSKRILKDLQFYDDGSLVSYSALFPGTKKRLKSNIIRINAKPADTMIGCRITELNELYEAIHHITPNLEGGAGQ